MLIPDQSTTSLSIKSCRTEDGIGYSSIVSPFNENDPRNKVVEKINTLIEYIYVNNERLIHKLREGSVDLDTAKQHLKNMAAKFSMIKGAQLDKIPYNNTSFKDFVLIVSNAIKSAMQNIQSWIRKDNSSPLASKKEKTPLEEVERPKI